HSPPDLGDPQRMRPDLPCSRRDVETCRPMAAGWTSGMTRRMSVDFYLYATHEVATWVPIVSALRERKVDARFVLEPPGRHLVRGSAPDPSRGWRDDKLRRDGRRIVDAATYERLTDALAQAGHEAADRVRPRGSVVTSL